MITMIEKLIIPGSYKMPNVILDPEAGIFEISGNSIPENAAKSYEPVYCWIDQNIDEIEGNISFIFKINHMNSSSVRAIFKLITHLDHQYLKGKQIEIQWYYDVEDDRDMGNIYASSTKIPFQFLKK